MSTQAEITLEAQRLMGDYARKVASGDITTQTLNAVRILGEELIRAEMEFLVTRKSLQAYHTNNCQFAIPTDDNGDVVSILKVWDMDTNAYAVEATASNSGEVQLTLTLPSGVTDHGFSDDDVVMVHDVGGTTEANGLWKIDDDSATKITLQDSTYANVWTSGGKVFKEEHYNLLDRMPSQDQVNETELKYFLRGAYIFVDDVTFENDIIVEYFTHPLALTDIPVRFHFGLPGYAAMVLIELPRTDDPEYVSLKTKQNIAQSIWTACLDMARGFRPVTESRNIATSTTIKRGWI